MNTQQAVWIKLLKLRTTSPMLFRALIILIAIELIVAFIAPLIIPDEIYLKGYLNEKAENSIRDFLKGEGYLIPDNNTGWRNNPNTSIKNWEIDSFGSRHHRDFSERSSKPIRTIFIGSSMINGGTGISNHETLSAYLEDTTIEALNFGTMLYSFDQSFELLKALTYLKPDVVVMGLDSDPISGLSNIYIPFRSKDEVNVAFLKPRYQYQNKQLVKIDVDPQVLNTLFQDGSLCDFLKQYDGYYKRFKRYVRFGHTPLSNTMGVALRKLESFSIYQYGQAENEIILRELMTKALSFAEEHQFKLIFLSTPAYSNLRPSRLMRLFPNWYKKRIERFRENDIPIIDVSDIFTRHNGDLWDLYSTDGVHFTATSNKLIADSLRPIILDWFHAEIQAPSN